MSRFAESLWLFLKWDWYLLVPYLLIAAWYFHYRRQLGIVTVVTIPILWIVAAMAFIGLLLSSNMYEGGIALFSLFLTSLMLVIAVAVGWLRLKYKARCSRGNEG